LSADHFAPLEEGGTAIDGFLAWIRKLFGSARSQPCADAQERSPDTLSLLRQARAEARRKVTEAEDRGDTRDYGRALMVLRQATHDELAAVRG
jgi:hypothetical protein